MNAKTYIGPAAILEKKKKYIMPCLAHFYKDPQEFVKGSMQYLWDSNGKKYLDCYAGVSVMNCGHANPDIVGPATEQAKTLQHVCNIYLTENFVNLAERLAAVTPGTLQKSFFCSTGSEATEGALLLAEVARGNSEIIALRQGLQDRGLVGEVAIEGADADPGPLGHGVGVESSLAGGLQKLSRGLEHDVDGVLRPRLPRRFASVFNDAHPSPPRSSPTSKAE